MNDSLHGKTILITGAARRVGRILALACGRAGANIIIHHGHSPAEADSLREELASLRAESGVLVADLSQPEQAAALVERAAAHFGPLYALVNNAAIFESLTFDETSMDDWARHMRTNLTAPFLLSQAFARQVPADGEGRIVNILDWRATHPRADHFPYTVSKSALAAMTKSLAVALAPRITVNGLALGAVLPPADSPSASETILKRVPAQRWAEATEVESALLFLLQSPSYVTGEIIHVDGGRHLT